MNAKRIMVLLLTIGSTVSLLTAAELPAAYYAPIENLADSALKATLTTLCSGGTRVSYGTQGYTYPEGIYYPASWNYFPSTDQRADGSIWDMYSNTLRYFPCDGGSAGGIQIEHCIPKSWWGWTQSDTASSKRAYRDLFILNPADAQANGQKNNYPPGHVTKGDKFDNGSFRMDRSTSSQYDWICFEPAEEYRGDFARTYFYAVTAYADLPWGANNTEYQRYLTDSTYLVFRPWLISVLLDWHRADPVSRKEIDRQDAVSTIQGNRNPFIDYPELVEYIWGAKQGQTVCLDSLVGTTHGYIPKEDYTNFAAYTPTDRTEEGFTAQWLNFDNDYTLSVYTREVAGTFDTVICMPTITPKRVDTTAHVAAIGKLNNAGTAGTTLGSGSTDGGLLFSGLHLNEETYLRFRANMYQTASNGEIDIYFGSHTTADTIITLPKSRDEQYYTITIPAGTDTVRLISVGGSTNKRACLHELYLLQGNRTETVVAVDGFPIALEKDDDTLYNKDNTSYSNAPFCEYWVSVPDSLRYTTLYYQLTTADGRCSNEVKVVGLPRPEGIAYPTALPSPATKVLRDGVVYILVNGQVYDVCGVLVSE